MLYNELYNSLLNFMAMQKFKNRNVRKIIKLGRGALAITVPVEFAKKLGWQEKQKACLA